MLVRMKKPKKAKSVMINQTPQVQSPIVPVHVTKTTTVLDEADAPGDAHNFVNTLKLCIDQKLMQPIGNQPRNWVRGRMTILNQVVNMNIC